MRSRKVVEIWRSGAHYVYLVGGGILRVGLARCQSSQSATVEDATNLKQLQLLPYPRFLRSLSRESIRSSESVHVALPRSPKFKTSRGLLQA